MSDLFITRNVKPMLIAENKPPFDDPDYIYELKWDGERCVAYLDPQHGTELKNKRQVKMLPKVPELSELHRHVKKRCILDGELTTLVDGKPKFEVIQRRSLMSNRFRIKLEAKKHPATFVAFDILYCDGELLTMRPLMERKKILNEMVTDTERIAVSRYVDGRGTDFYHLAEQQQLEGIVAKRKDCIYVQGKRTQSWIKIKNMQDDDYVVCGYIKKSGSMTSIVLGQYRGTELVYKGHVTLGVGGRSFTIISEQPTYPHPPCPVPDGHGNENAVWIEPTLVCTVEYMHLTKNGGMRQPVFKGLRDDKAPKDCKEKREG